MAINRNSDFSFLCAEHRREVGSCPPGCDCPRLIDPYDLEDIVKKYRNELEAENQRYCISLRDNELEHNRVLKDIEKRQNSDIERYSWKRDTERGAD